MSTSTPSFAEALSFPGGHDRGIAAGQPVLGERRSKLRYPLNLSVRFRPLAGPLFCGAGLAVNVSSGGVLVVSQDAVSPHKISVGARVESSIEWPTLLDGRVPLQLFAVGRVVRHRASDFAATFERYQFRTLRSSHLQPGRLAAAAVQSPV